MEINKLKNVILITTDENAIGYKFENNSEVLKGIQVVSEEYELPAMHDKITFIGLQPDKEQVFIKSPFDKNEYFEISKAEDLIFTKKIIFYKRIALLLGAKSFSAKAQIIEEKKSTFDANLNVSHKVVQVDVAIKKEQEAKLEKLYSLDSNFSDNSNNTSEFDRQRGFEEAKKLIKEQHLESELVVVSLIDNNDPSLQNRENRQHVKLELTSELNDLLEMSFNINAMGGVFSLGANFKSTTETIKKIVLDTEIVF